MACSKSLRTDLLPTAPGGGTWVYNGYNSTSSTGPWNQIPGVPLVVVSPGSQYGTGDNPFVHTNGRSPGFYKFTYTLGAAGPCPDSAELVIELQALECAGADVSVTYCTNDVAVKNLYTLINTGSPCGTATIDNVTNPTAPGGPGTSVYTASAPTTLTFQPSANAAGTHVIVNSVDTDPSVGFTQVPCGCTDSATVTITNIAAFSAGTIGPTTDEVCANGGCTVDLSTFVTGSGTTTGAWRYINSSPTNGNVTLSVNGGAYTSFAPNTNISTTLNTTINLQNAVKGRTYNFQWLTQPGTACQSGAGTLSISITPNSAGTAPAWSPTACLGQMITLTGDTFALWDVLGGSPATTGNWTVTSSNPNVRTLNALNTGVAGTGTDDEFTWSAIEGFVTGQWVPIPASFNTTLTFTYTPTNPGQCANCAGDPVSWQIYVNFGVEAGTGGPVTICDGGTYDPFDWLTGAQVGNYWQAITNIPGLTNLNSAQTGFTAGQNITSQNDPLTDRSRPALDWSGVADGTYTIRYRSSAGACFDFADVVVTVTNLPCGGGFIEADFWHDLSAALDGSEGWNPFLTSAVYDGVEYVGAPVALTPVNVITLDGEDYNTTVADALNALGIPEIEFSYSTADDCTGVGKQKFVHIKWPDCKTFEILIEGTHPLGFNTKWTEIGLYRWNGASWVIVNPTYSTGSICITAPSKSTGNDCP